MFILSPNISNISLMNECVHKLETNARKYYHINSVSSQITFVLKMKIIQRNQVPFYPHDPWISMVACLLSKDQLSSIKCWCVQ